MLDIRILQHICIDSVSWVVLAASASFVHCGSALCRFCADATARERFFASSCTVFPSQLSLNLLLCFFSFAQVGVLVMLRCLLSRAMLLLPLSSLCIPTFRVVASSSSRCCLLTLRDFARSCSLAAFSAPLLCLHSRSLAALSGLCRLALS